MKKPRRRGWLREVIVWDKRVCFYCGLMAEVWEHVAPYSRIERAGGEYAVVVRACKECNYVLGSRFFGSIWDRAFHIFQVYLDRYYVELTTDEKELEDLGYVFRETIERRLAVKAITLERLRWLDTVENRLSEEHALIVESLLTDLEIHEEYIARSSVDRPKVIEIVNELLMISKEK